MTARDAVTAHAALVLELMIGGLTREGAEAKVTAYDEVQRAEVLREAARAIEQAADADEADAIANDGVAYGMSNKAVAIRREDAELLRRLADTPRP